MFISQPFWACPRCGNKSFGVYRIRSHNYSRRCKECHYPKGTDEKCIYPLPPLKKKTVYLDQLAISNMMKALNWRQGHAKVDGQDEFWLEAFKELYKLCRLQLIVCPESGFHREESSLYRYFKETKKMYELLSCDVKFKSDDEIKIEQICEHAQNWLVGQPEKRVEIFQQSVMDGKIDAWQERFTISIDWDRSDEIVDGLRKARSTISKRLEATAKRWQQEKEKDFDDWFKEESSGYGKVVLKELSESLQGLMDAYKGEREMAMDDIMIPFSLPCSLVQSLKWLFVSNGVDDKNVCSKVCEYLNSDSLKNVPFVEISTLLFAALARKYASGMRKPPDEGLETDINIVSVLLPYCDAMFIDNQMHGYLKEKPVCERISHGTKVFSLNHKKEFIPYLNSIEENASKEHIEELREVYGEDSFKYPC